MWTKCPELSSKRLVELLPFLLIWEMDDDDDDDDDDDEEEEEEEEGVA
jgi:hypothetical protein